MTSDDKKKIRAKVESLSHFIDGGKLPPQEIEMEEAVLGGLLLQARETDEVIDILKPDCFYKDQHQRIYEAVQELYTKGETVDILTVMKRLKDKGDLDLVGGAYYISQLTNKVASGENIIAHSEGVYEAYLKRELIILGNDIVKKAYDLGTEPDKIHTETQMALDNIVNFNSNDIPFGFEDVHQNFMEKNPKLLELKGVSGIPCGINTIDRLIGGWQNTDLVILAARPGMGKTSLALLFFITAAKLGYCVIFFSLEMSREQLFYRIASIETGIEIEKFTKKGLNPVELQTYQRWKESIKDWNIKIDDTPALSVQEMRVRVKQMRKRKPAQLILVDYVQLCTYKDFNGGNRNEEVGKVSGALKGIAKEFDVPIIALSQLSRSVETRGGSKEPMLSDLRESGSLEQDSDIVQFLYRPEYYGITEDEKGQSLLGVAKIITAKHRNGGLDDSLAMFNGKTVTFSNMPMFNAFSPNDNQNPQLEEKSGGMQPNQDFDKKTPATDIPF